MTKSELIAELAASHPHLRQMEVELLVTTIFDQIADALAHGGRVELRGFGAFGVKRRDARIGRNPRTGEAVPVHAKTAPFFKAGRELRGRLNRKPIRTVRGVTAAPSASASAVAAAASTQRWSWPTPAPARCR